MKVCPICHARAFDDAKVCFGCMHRFGEESARVLPAPAAPAQGAHAEVAGVEAPPSFLIKLTPPSLVDASRAWTCSVELAHA